MDPGGGRILLVVLVLLVLGMCSGHGQRQPRYHESSGREVLSDFDQCMKEKPFYHEFQCRDLKRE